jgi:tetratricopeptide (TPR) repeat protein
LTAEYTDHGPGEGYLESKQRKFDQLTADTVAHREKPTPCFSFPWHCGAPLAFVVLGCLLYGHTLNVPFYLDDAANLRDNLPPLQSFSVRDLVETAFGGLLRRRPLANLTFTLNAYFHGSHVAGYHLVNILIHILNSILLYLVLFKTFTLAGNRRAFQYPGLTALFAGIWWFVHPIQTQTVTYVVQRMTSMATLFSIASLLAYILGRLSLQKGSRVALLLAAFCFWLLAMASKEIALTVPVVVFFYEWFFFQDLSRRWFIRRAGYAVAGLATVLWVVHLFYGYSPVAFLTVIDQPRGFTALERLLTELRVVFLYIGLLIYPHPSRLTLNHDVAISHSILDPATTLLSFVGLLALAAAAFFLAKRHRVFAFCIIWFLVNLSVEALAASIEPMFEHRLYLPSMLFFVPFVCLGFRCVRKPLRIFPLMTVWLVLLSLWTYQRNDLWKDPVAFWTDAVGKTPNHYRPYFHLGTSYLEAGQYQNALPSLLKALSLEPPYPTEILTNIGMLYYKDNKPDLARQNLERALALNRNNYVALDLLGTLCRTNSDYDCALTYYQRAIAMNPDFVQSSHNMAAVYSELGRTADAIRMFEHVIAMRPRWSQAKAGLGLALAKQGEFARAVEMLNRAIAEDETNQEALFNLAVVYDMTGRYEMAAETYEKVLAINARDVETMHNLGIIYLTRVNKVERAKACFEKALRTEPEYPHAAAAQSILSQIDTMDTEKRELPAEKESDAP